ncbi:hypothetical protein GDO81_019668 [Engystomops pustulosus]|uniref:Uncharacterized protein n=1 Tax=Engystomops pustulosus TaxID=76066 RepID=A0AAV6ZT65_ENGPU|nr:hypothetical protein GDO81_019668 [Engystomops pustulosus]
MAIPPLPATCNHHRPFRQLQCLCPAPGIGRPVPCRQHASCLLAPGNASLSLRQGTCLLSPGASRLPSVPAPGNGSFLCARQSSCPCARQCFLVPPATASLLSPQPRHASFPAPGNAFLSLASRQCPCPGLPPGPIPSPARQCPCPPSNASCPSPRHCQPVPQARQPPALAAGKLAVLAGSSGLRQSAPAQPPRSCPSKPLAAKSFLSLHPALPLLPGSPGRLPHCPAARHCTPVPCSLAWPPSLHPGPAPPVPCSPGRLASCPSLHALACPGRCLPSANTLPLLLHPARTLAAPLAPSPPALRPPPPAALACCRAFHTQHWSHHSPGGTP